MRTAERCGACLQGEWPLRGSLYGVGSPHFLSLFTPFWHLLQGVQSDSLLSVCPSVSQDLTPDPKARPPSWTQHSGHIPVAPFKGSLKQEMAGHSQGPWTPPLSTPDHPLPRTNLIIGEIVIVHFIFHARNGHPNKPSETKKKSVKNEPRWRSSP